MPSGSKSRCDAANVFIRIAEIDVDQPGMEPGPFGFQGPVNMVGVREHGLVRMTSLSLDETGLKPANLCKCPAFAIFKRLPGLQVTQPCKIICIQMICRLNELEFKA